MAAPAAPLSVTAFAPATVSNLAAGFDVFGFAMGQVGDRVTVRRQDTVGRDVAVSREDATSGNATASRDRAKGNVRIASIGGVVTDLPREPDENTASVALLAMLEEHPLPFGLEVDLDKGIPLGSGMGGSAASAVAAVVAGNAFLDRPLSPAELLRYAVAGEQAASGSPHADNVAPSLYGGLTAVVGVDPLEAVSLPVPAGLRYVVAHPRLEIETRQARAVLAPASPLERHVRQSMHVAGFVAACYSGDLGLLARSMVDLVAEPVRAPLIPGYHDAKSAAMGAGALGFGIAGAGPSVFALVGPNGTDADLSGLVTAISAAFAAHGVDSDSWVGTIRRDGATVESSEP